MIGATSIALIILIIIVCIAIIFVGSFIRKRKGNLAREAKSSQEVIRESEKNLPEAAAGRTRFTVLVENNLREGLAGLKSAHGISIFVERDGKSFLLDTGPGDEFYHNAVALGKKIEDVDFAFISHGHYDHGGGLALFLEKNGKAPVYLSRQAMEERHVAKIAGVIKKDVSIDPELARKYPGRFKYTEGKTEIAEGIFAVSGIGHAHPLPSGNAILFRDSGNGLVPDDFAHEQALVIRERDGLIVFSGCCHNGVLNVIDAVKTQFPGEAVKAVIGGFHLYNPVMARMDENPTPCQPSGRGWPGPACGYSSAATAPAWRRSCC